MNRPNIDYLRRNSLCGSLVDFKKQIIDHNLTDFYIVQDCNCGGNYWRLFYQIIGDTQYYKDVIYAHQSDIYPLINDFKNTIDGSNHKFYGMTYQCQKRDTYVCRFTPPNSN